jgi:putative nucleotidyltransferase with HDIG domain
MMRALKIASLYLERISGKKEELTEKFLRKAISEMPKYRGHAYIAGGYVRDQIMNLNPKDLDVMVDLPEGGVSLAKDMSDKYNLREPIIFERFGTAKLVLIHKDHTSFIFENTDLSDMEIEFVSSRKEHYHEDSRNPDIEHGTAKEDVERRDFTVNSLLKDLTTGEILDLTGRGKEDIEKGVIRTPLNPDKTFSDDALRMLRAIRFAVKYDWSLPKFMLKAIKNNAHRLKTISQERIRDELNKILVTKSPSRGIKLLSLTGLMEYVAPEITGLKGLQQGKRYHDTDALKHTFRVLDYIKPNIVSRLTALFHDIGKSTTQKIEGEETHFYKHEEVGSEMVKRILEKLRYPNDIIDKVVFNVREHMRGKGWKSNGWSPKSFRKFVKDMGEHLEDVLDILEADAAGHTKSRAPESIEEVKKFREKIKEIQKESPKETLRSPLNGKEIMDLLGIGQSKAVGKAMEFLTDAVLENPNLSHAEAMNLLVKHRDKIVS